MRARAAPRLLASLILAAVVAACGTVDVAMACAEPVANDVALTTDVDGDEATYFVRAPADSALNFGADFSLYRTDGRDRDVSPTDFPATEFVVPPGRHSGPYDLWATQGPGGLPSGDYVLRKEVGLGPRLGEGGQRVLCARFTIPDSG